MYTVYLAVWLSLINSPPAVLEPAKDLDSCLIAAARINKDPDTILKTPEAVAAGAQAVCLKVVKADV